MVPRYLGGSVKVDEMSQALRTGGSLHLPDVVLRTKEPNRNQGHELSFWACAGCNLCVPVSTLTSAL